MSVQAPLKEGIEEESVKGSGTEESDKGSGINESANGSSTNWLPLPDTVYAVPQYTAVPVLVLRQVKE
jgi:hypothetical protein